MDHYALPITGENSCDDVHDVFHYSGDTLDDICERLDYSLRHWRQALNRRDNNTLDEARHLGDQPADPLYQYLRKWRYSGYQACEYRHYGDDRQ